ncbi:MAG: hypothetical protein ACYS4W_09905 [Planctomycetota bacterium]|jgi:hypothetical protein
MKAEEIYRDWQAQKRETEVSPVFSDRVMSRIGRYEQEKRRWPFDVQQLVELISARPLAKVVLLGTGAVIGLIRIACILSGLFGHYGYCG